MAPPDQHVSIRALQAATSVAHRLGVDCVDPTILHHSEHISIALFPSDIVARVVRAENIEAEKKLRREVEVGRHLVQKGAPVVSPATDVFAGPHLHDGFALTLWQYVKHVAADGDNPAHRASAAEALRRVHDALADFPGELPSFRSKIDGCRTSLESRSALPALNAADRRFLLTAHDRVIASLDALPLRLVPIHGDAAPHNVLITPDGARYNDFEDACLGPREWDVWWLADVDLIAFEPIDRNLLAVLRVLRSLCVSVWCWAKYDMPEKREAAEYHLGYLKELFVNGSIRLRPTPQT
jgi:hypothetical protein